MTDKQEGYVFGYLMGWTDGVRDAEGPGKMPDRDTLRARAREEARRIYTEPSDPLRLADELDRRADTQPVLASGLRDAANWIRAEIRFRERGYDV